MKKYDWNEIIKIIQSFAKVEDISDIILLGDKKGVGQGVRRIELLEIEE
jgi:metallophosphoesterase superfamily enzyme